MTHEKPLILIANDDGINAPGIHELINYVADMGQIVAIAPDAPRSGQSSAISVNKVLRVTRHDDYNGAEMYSVNGTPVDCVKLGMHAILPRRPDLILSGINHGSNSGNSIIYSGTMGRWVMEWSVMISTTLLASRPNISSSETKIRYLVVWISTASAAVSSASWSSVINSIFSSDMIVIRSLLLFARGSVALNGGEQVRHVQDDADIAVA